MKSICKIKDIYKALYLFEKEFQKVNGITINEALVLCCLKKGTPKPANEICSFIGLSNSRVSRIITSVEEKGFITRELGSNDKRQMIFQVSEKGMEKINEMEKSELSFKEFLKLTKIKS